MVSAKDWIESGQQKDGGSSPAKNDWAILLIKTEGTAMNQ